MAITLDMAQPLESQIKKMIKELYEELNNNLEVTYRRGEEPEMPTRSVEQLLNDITFLEADRMKLRKAREVANLNSIVPYKLQSNNTNESQSIPTADKLCISEALYLAKTLRYKLDVLKRMASKKDKPQAATRSYLSMKGNTPVDEITTTTYDVSAYKKYADKMERRINALSIAIDKANQNTTIDFDASSYLDGLDM